jgi:hypothetical protein
MNEIKRMLDKIEKEMVLLSDLPETAVSLNAIEITLQDLARIAHYRAWRMIRNHPSVNTVVKIK